MVGTLCCAAVAVLAAGGEGFALAGAGSVVSAAFRRGAVPVVGFALAAGGGGGVVHRIVMFIIHGCLPPVLLSIGIVRELRGRAPEPGELGLSVL